MERLQGHAPVPRQHLRHRSQESERQTTRREKAAGEWQGNRGQHPARASATVKAHPGRSRARGLAARPRGKELRYDENVLFRPAGDGLVQLHLSELGVGFVSDQVSTRLNSSHLGISYAV